jgi:UDP-galactopyranose mutase
MSTSETNDLLVFSKFRWDFLHQRPQHILSRHARNRRVFYFEKPVFGMTECPRLHLRETTENVLVVIPYLPSHIRADAINEAMIDLVNELILDEELSDYTLWYYGAEALEYSHHLSAKNIIYDCMESSSSEGERELLREADLIYVNNEALYKIKKDENSNIHLVDNAVDYQHFHQARQKLVEPDDQINIPHPRIGVYGVIDNKIDLKLLKQIADLQPDYHFVIVGPILNIHSEDLPKRVNIHYLDKKDYHALPLYLAGWDCAFMPLALNEHTKYYAPQEVLEFLAAGRPVVTTAINNIVQSNGLKSLVHIAESPQNFIDHIELAIEEKKLPEWIQSVDSYLEGMSWDNAFIKMAEAESSISSKSDLSKEAKIIQPLILNTSRVN